MIEALQHAQELSMQARVYGGGFGEIFVKGQWLPPLVLASPAAMSSGATVASALRSRSRRP
jgi:hypothetical protein